MYISDKYLIQFLSECIQQFEPTSILDVGLVFERIGVVSMEYENISDACCSIIDGVASREEYIAPYYTAFYRNIMHELDSLETYDLVIMLEAYKLFDDERLNDIYEAINHNGKKILLDYCTYTQLKCKDRKVVCIGVGDNKYCILV